MSAEFNTQDELSRVSAEIAATKEKLATLNKVKIGLIPDQKVTKGLGALTEKEFCEKALAAIEVGAHDPNFNLPALSAAIGFGPIITSMILNRSYKRSFPQLLTDARIKLASELLGSGVSIKQVAYKSGFSDNHYFSRVFTKSVGITPTAFVKMRRQADEAAKSEPVGIGVIE